MTVHNVHDAPPPTARTRFSDWPLAVKSILGFWFFYALTVVARAFLGHRPLDDARKQAGRDRRSASSSPALIYVAIAAL